jgi:starvation-inducible outer membrane lipoprotein
MTPLPGASIGTSACIALPSKIRRAASSPNSCSAVTSGRQQQQVRKPERIGSTQLSQ